MRGKRALKNMITGMLMELVVLICGLITPRLILGTFGSEYNGIVASISQFLSGVVLLKAGVENVTKAALYKPLAQGDTEKISSIVMTMESFMRRIAVIFLGMILLLACLYPQLVEGEFSWWFTASLVVILSISTFAQYFFGLSYSTLLQAHQRNYITHYIRIAVQIVNTIAAAILIKSGASIHTVKLSTALIFAANPLVTHFYVRKRYRIDRHAKVDNKLISQRWDAFGQAVALFVNDNTDLIVLTLFTNLYEVSVYTVYNAVMKGMKQIMNISTSGFSAAFGDMYAKGEMDAVERNLRITELILFSVASILYSVAAAMLVPYAVLYTKGVTDVNYARPVFAVLISLCGASVAFRMPYQTLIGAVGHFKQNRKAAFLEAGLNIVISLLAVARFGLVGVSVGTVVAELYRSTQNAWYVSRNLVKRSLWIYIGHVGQFAVTMAAVWVFAQKLILPMYRMNVQSWIVCAVLTTLIAGCITLVIDMVFYRESLAALLKKMTGIVRRR